MYFIMNKTIIQFDFVKLGENDYCTDPASLYIFGYVNLNLLNELLTDKDCLSNFENANTEIGKSETLKMEIWEDMDDYKTWYDYKFLPNDYPLALP